MDTTVRLIKRYSDIKHPLGRPIQIEDIPLMMERLQNRLEISTNEMELSLQNIRRMEKHLVNYYASLQEKEQNLEGEGLVDFIRELTVYIGECIRMNASGTWDENHISLWTTHVSVNGPWDVRKDKHYVSLLPTAFGIAQEAAYCWDRIMSGQRPTLYKLYKIIQTKKLQEDFN